MRRFFEIADTGLVLDEARGSVEIAARAVVSSVGKWTPGNIDKAVTDAVGRYAVDRVDLEAEVERLIGEKT